MPGIVVGHLNEPASLEPVFEALAQWNPGFRMGTGAVDADEAIIESAGGVRHIWLAEGEGRVYLPEGYRTKEGDGILLPREEYAVDALDSEMRAALQCLSKKMGVFHEKIQTPVNAILARWRDPVFVGDIAGEIWLILESGLPEDAWTSDAEALQTLRFVIARYRDIGWSTKQTGSFERLIAGDQLIATPAAPLRVGGRFRYWWIENPETTTHISAARRLRYLKDTAGGCNFAFDAFRRLPLTWYANTGAPDHPDGINRVNSHVVNIAAETSQTHYHPSVPVGGGKPQSEMYLVLDPATYALNTHGRTPWLFTFPDLNDLSVYEKTRLSPGSTVYIRPDTGHRGVNVFVNVVTLPGFKPGNEIYLDQKIKDRTNGRAPYNEHVTR